MASGGKIAWSDQAEEGVVLFPRRRSFGWFGEERGAWGGAGFGSARRLGFGTWGAGLSWAAEDGRGGDAEHVAEGAEDAAR